MFLSWVTVKKQWMHHAPKGAPQWTYARRMNVTDQWKRNTPYWQQCSEDVKQCLQQLTTSPVDTSDQHHQTVNHAVPIVKNTQAPRTSFGSVQLYTEFCECTSLIRHITQVKYDCKPIFHLWHLIATRTRLQKQMTHNSRAARKARLREIMQKAQEAADSKDQYELYQRIRQLAPKQINKRVQLRNEVGELLTPQESAQQIANWWKQVYTGRNLDFDTLIESWPFLDSDIHRAFASFDARKALDPHCAPSVVWKAHSQLSTQATH